jgi:hypothetical protein
VALTSPLPSDILTAPRRSVFRKWGSAGRAPARGGSCQAAGSTTKLGCQTVGISWEGLTLQAKAFAQLEGMMGSGRPAAVVGASADSELTTRQLMVSTTLPPLTN